MHDLPLAGSRSHGRASAFIAAVVAVALFVLAPLVPAPFGCAGRARRGPRASSPRVTGIAPLEKQVYGYLPYWRLDAGTADRLDYDLVSTIALFGLGIKKDGNIDMAWRGTQAYLSDDAAAVTNAAHAKGVRVVPTFQLFDSGTLPDMKAFLHSKAAQSRFIQQALALMDRRSADGANFDFEPMPSTLVARLRVSSSPSFRTAMVKQFPKAKLVVATIGRAAARADQRAREDRRQDAGDDLQLPLVGVDGDRGDRAARQHDPNGQAPHRPLPEDTAAVEDDHRRAVLRL